MYNCLTKIRDILIIGIVLLCFNNNTLGFNLTDEIYAEFGKYYNGGYSDSYLETSYAPNYPKDPFKDSLEDIEDMSMQIKIAGAEYVENLLKEEGCQLAQKKIRAILYHFVPEFKTELTRTLKIGLGDYSSRNFILSDDEILDYCKEYFLCEKSQGYSAWQIFKEEVLNGNDLRGISSSTPANIETNCKEFFQKNYRRGQDDESKKQAIQVSQLGNDKFRNSTTDDSPYDIMIDLGTIGKLLYTDAEQPITPVFYNLPVFSNSKKSLKDHKENGSSYNNNNNGGEQNGDVGGNKKNNNGGDSTNPIPLPLPRGSEGFSMEGGYDNLIEGLSSSRLENNSILNGNICDESDENDNNEDYDNEIEGNNSNVPNLSNASDEELEEVVEYMKGAVDKYTSLTDEQKSEIATKAGDTSRFLGDITPSELDRTAEEIKNCWQSCEGLRIDQKASCMLMCACGEIDSPIFDPQETPGLGPIFMIKFCTIPGVDTRFAKGGRKIVSIEEGIKEIYGVVDKLSREGRLGIWTQQYNFLDSTTKKTKVADTVAFTINIEFEDIANKFPNHSNQYNEKEIKKINEIMQGIFYISNNLENPIAKNRYRLVGKLGEAIDDYSTKGNPEGTKQSISNLSVTPGSVDPNSDSRASHKANISELLDKWLDQQGDFRIQSLEYVDLLTKDTKALDAKPKIK